MGKPIIKSGKFTVGADLQCGENVVIDVAEEVIVGDRCVIPDNAYFSGRRVEIGDDFYGYSWEHPGFPRRVNDGIGGLHTRLGGPVGSWLEIGRGRIDDASAVLVVGNRCTFHDNRIDLAREVTIGDDVGLSPEVAIYTHYYWQSILEGYPFRLAPVLISSRVLVGFRSALLPGVAIGEGSVIGAQSVVTGIVGVNEVWVGNPAKKVGDITSPMSYFERLNSLVEDYHDSVAYRNLPHEIRKVDGNHVYIRDCRLDVESCTVSGIEDEYSDDLRDFLFKHGVRIYTKRPFRKLGRRA